MSGRLKILVVANLPPFVLGGAENQVARLVESWLTFGHEVEVAGHQLPAGTVPLGASRVRTHEVKAWNRFGRAGRALGFFLSLARLLLREQSNFDVVYCRGLGDAALTVCVLKALRLSHLPVVACPINAGGRGDAHFIRSIPGWPLLTRAVDRHCDAINIIAPAIEADIQDLDIRRPRIARIPNGIAIGKPVKHRRSGTGRQFIFLGRLSPQKGLDLLLDAFHQLYVEGQKFSLEIIGDGPERETLMTQCERLRLAQFVRFAGAIPIDEVRERLAAADVFVLPSRYEGMSNAALEAMEAGVAVVLSRCGGIDTYVRDDMGWVCDPGDQESLVAALREATVAEPERLMGMGRMARRLVEERFDIRAIAQRNIDLFREIVATQPMRTTS